MDIDKRLALYEKLYFHELDSRNKIEARLRLPFAIFAGLFAILAFLAKVMVTEGFLPRDVFFWVLYVAAVVAFAMSVTYFVKAWYGYDYRYLPAGDVLEGYFNEILAEYKKDYPKKSEAWAEEAFTEYLLKTYAEYSGFNARNNDNKSNFVHKCIGSLLVAIILAGIAYLPFYAALTDTTLANKEAPEMSDKPAPPPPPPPRNVKGEYPTKKKPPEPKS